MLEELADRTTGVRGNSRGGGQTVSHEVDTYKFVIWDWLDTLSNGWSTIDPEKGLDIFRMHTGECVTLTALDGAIRSEIDRQLRAIPGYVGAFVLDPGNPIRRRAFADLLIYGAAIFNGAVVQELSYEGTPDWPIAGADSFEPGGLIWKPYGWLAEHGPPPLAAAPPSTRGARSASALARKHAGRVEHRVIAAIRSAFAFKTLDRSFAFEVVGTPADVLQALMPEGKFTHYLFNVEHEKGGPKSRFFTETLGIEPDDWRFLAAQFYEGLLRANPEDVELQDWGAGYGMRFNAYMRVQGRSGVTAVVKTGWMMRPQTLPSLSSAMPADPRRKVVQPSPPQILPPKAETDADWAKLWSWADDAGVRALEKTVPTPLFLQGFPRVAEGKSGFGIVRVSDARRGFALWLARRGPGMRASGDAVVRRPPSTNSLERGVAWARAVARVLKLNGLNVEVEQHPT